MPAGMIVRDLTPRSQRRECGRYVDKGGCVTVPLTDENGAIVAIEGHRLDSINDHGVCNGKVAVALLPGDGPCPDNESSPDDELILDENQILFHREVRRCRIRGLEKNASTCTLKVALMVSRDSLIHLDSLDLVKAASRNAFIKAAAAVT